MLHSGKSTLGLMLIAAVVAVRVGPALTAADSPAPSAGDRLGYAAQGVSGAHVTGIDYTIDARGVTVATVTVVALGDLTQEHAFAGFTVAGTPGPTLECGTGTYDGTNATTFVCDTTSLDQDVATIQATDITVLD